MIARVRTESGFYDSVVFAIFYNKNDSEAVVFDEGMTALKRVRFNSICGHSIRRDVFLFDTREESWFRTEDKEGFDWLLGRALDDTLLDRCKGLQAQVNTPEWLDLKTQEDVDGMCDATVGLHDGYVKKIYRIGDKLYIRFTAWSCEVLFELTGSPETNLIVGYGHMSIGNEYPLIDDSSVFFENGKICWTDDFQVRSLADLKLSRPAYFLAEHIRWRLTLTSAC